MIGIHHKWCQNCKDHAAAMDGNGPEWCRENIEIITGWMREAAAKQSLPFSESQSRWLVNLAITLAEVNRDHSMIERARLAVMKRGLAWLSKPNRVPI